MQDGLGQNRDMAAAAKIGAGRRSTDEPPAGAADDLARSDPADELGAPLPDEVPRSALVAQLAGRFSTPVTLVVAGAGFGKSTALAQAVRANAVLPDGLDVVHRCSVADDDPAVLAGAVGRALGADVGHRDPDRAARRLAEVVAAQAPAEVALVLDDVHVLDADGPGAALLTELVRLLPANGHLVLAGRTVPPLPLARLRAADGVAVVGEADLAFSSDEVAQLAAANDVDLGVDHLGGWPAVVRLSVAVGHEAGADYLWEEVLAHADPDQRRALAALALGGRLPVAALAEVVGGDADVEALLADLPLIELDRASGTAAAHGLWSDALDRLADRSERVELTGALAWQLARVDDHERALPLAVAAGDPDLVARLVLDGLARGMLHFDRATTERWLHLLPPEVRRLPAGRLLEAVGARKAGTTTAATSDELWALADELHDLGDAAGEAVALGELGGLAFTQQRRDDLAAVDERVRALQADSPGRLRTLGALVAAWRADADGDPEGALAALGALEQPRPAVQRLVDHWRSSLLVLAGRADEAVAHGAAVGADTDYLPLRASEAVARWFAGDPTPIAASGIPPMPDLEARDAFLAAVHVAMFRSSLEGTGQLVDLDRLAELAGEDGRDQAFVALCRAAQAIADGDEAGAAATVDALCERFALDGVAAGPGPDDGDGSALALDGRAEHELRRFLPYAYVLSERWRASIDAAELGPVHRRRRALARLLLDLRAGRTPDWSTWTTPGEAVASLPLRWNVELAARASRAGRSEGDELAAVLGDLLDEPGRAALRRATDDEDPTVAAGAADLLARVPVPPASVVRIELVGPPRLLRDGVAVDDPAWRRRRVRQLVGLLALRRTLRRDEAIAAIWPDADEAAGGRNLRTTLSHLRKLLEPDRRTGEAPWFLRQRGDVLELAGEPHLEVDLWELRRHRAAATEAEAGARTSRALAHHRAVVERWRGDPLADLRDVEVADHERIELEQAVVASAQRAAELSLAAGEPDGVPDLVATVLAVDPYHEGALRLAVLEALARHDGAAARRAAARCRAVLDELGVPPTPATDTVLRRAEGPRPAVSPEDGP